MKACTHDSFTLPRLLRQNQEEMHKCEQAHLHICVQCTDSARTHTHTHLCSSEAVPFHVRMLGLICGELVPCCD